MRPDISPSAKSPLRIQKINIAVILTIIFLGSILSGCSVNELENPVVSNSDESYRTMITIDPRVTFQEIDGFGVSSQWWAQIVGGWQENNRNRVIELLFDPSDGIGLTIMRYNIGAGGGATIYDPWKRTVSYETANGFFDWERDENAVRILQLAQEAGVQEFVAYANSPPPRLTRSGKVTGSFDGGSNLGFNQEQAYVDYLVKIVKHLVYEKNIPIKWISPANEPEKEWSQEDGQEGCHFSPEEYSKLINLLQEKLLLENLNLSIMVPESSSWSESIDYLNALNINPPIQSNSSKLVAVHSYDTEGTDKTSLSNEIKLTNTSVKIWMTEWSDNANSQDYGIMSALNLAKVVQEDITLGGVSSWHYALAVSKYSDYAGLIHTRQGTQTIIETKRLWGLGNYSRFVRPGDRVILATVNESGLSVSAFISQSQERITLVVINPTKEEIAANIIINDWNWFKLIAFQTSENDNLTQVYEGALPESFIFNAQSITSFIISP